MGTLKLTAVLSITLFLGLLCAPAMAQDEEEEPQPKDTPFFSGMPNYKISDTGEKEFDEYRFFNGKDCTTVEGRKFYRAYTLKEEATAASEIQIARNYANALRSMGGTIVFDGMCEGAECAENNGYRMVVGKVSKGGGELWVEVVPYGDGNDYTLTVVVKGEMSQDITAGAMLDALNKDGRIALYINFDTGKSTIRPDSKPVIDQIVQLMKTNGALELGVEGHTDNVGDAKSNQTLSENRANAVVTAIVAQGIEAKRLSAAGHGQDKPVADNSSEEGRAKNRRVELVKKGAAPSSAPAGAPGSAKTEERFGVKVYPGAQLDDAQTKYAKAAGFDLYCYRTNDSLAKVIAFYKGQTGLELLFNTEDSAIFSDGGTVKVTATSPWTDPMTGKSRSDTVIQILNEGE
jgi:outer membrane protein OmpA-like peptidoglycan-associated protein